MKLTPDNTIKREYRTTKLRLLAQRHGGGRNLADLEARLEFLERIFDL